MFLYTLYMVIILVYLYEIIISKNIMTVLKPSERFHFFCLFNACLWVSFLKEISSLVHYVACVN